MDMSKEDRDLFEEHLYSIKDDGIKCPMCGNIEWNIAGLHLLDCFDPAVKKIKLDGTRIKTPVAIINCHKCYHIEMFAWRPIRESRGEMLEDQIYEKEGEK